MPFYQSRGTPEAIWMQMDYTATIYWGSFACIDESDVADNEGVIMLPVAAGAYNITNYDVPLGIVIGDNLRTKTYNSTGLCNYITGGNPHDSTTEYVLTGGPFIGGGREPFVKCTLVDPTTIMRGNLVVDAPGTAPTVVTGASAASTTGVALTTGAVDVATIDGRSTIYFRSGANKGQYRRLDSAASTTVHTWNLPTYADTAVGDTAVVVNMVSHGLCRAQLAATYCNCWDIDAAVTSDYYGIDVVRLDLADAGNEYVEFRWNIMNFFPYTDRTASA